jgi:hypothetical protein
LLKKKNFVPTLHEALCNPVDQHCQLSKKGRKNKEQRPESPVEMAEREKRFSCHDVCDHIRSRKDDIKN